MPLTFLVFFSFFFFFSCAHLWRTLLTEVTLCEQVSPHEFLQAVMKASKKRFRIGQQSDPVEFMSWLLNTLHMDLRTSKDASSIIHQCFQVWFRPMTIHHYIVWYNWFPKAACSSNLQTISGWVGGCERVSRQWKQRSLQDAFPDAWARFATASSFQRCHGEKHHSSGIYTSCFRFFSIDSFKPWKSCYSVPFTIRISGRMKLMN